ncbi:MAG: FtsW/RodA/SpoVE family cell cycle protein [Candidatus Levyibacteriota bacterium]
MKRGGILNIELGLLIPVFVLVSLGLATLFSINVSYFKSQLVYIILSFLVFIFFANVNYRIFRLYYVQIYIISIIAFIIVLLLGFETRGTMRWVDIFGFRIQFSEVLKPFLAVSFSSMLANSRKSFKSLLLSIAYLIPIVFLVYIQPDLGNALIYFFVALLTLVVTGFPLIWFGLGFFFMAGLSPLFWRMMHGYQRERILTFINPNKDILGTSYNAIQSIVAVGSGMILGRGLGEGTQSGLRFLPEQYTDFIFATISESFGFLGGLLIIISFAFLLYKIYSIYRDSEDKFCKIFSACVFFLILVQLFINIGMNIGIVPIVGITLPFVSYGGSSLLSNFILLGFLSSIGRDIKEQETLEIK